MKVCISMYAWRAFVVSVHSSSWSVCCPTWWDINGLLIHAHFSTTFVKPCYSYQVKLTFRCCL